MSKTGNSPALHRSAVPAMGVGMRGEQGHVGYLLMQAAGAFRLRMARALAERDVTPPQFAVLTMLSAYPGLSNADLARLALLTPQTLSVIVANLLRAGAVTRQPHAIHGRIQNVELTKKGQELLANCRKRVHAIERRAEEGLTAGEARVLRQWLVRIAMEDDAKAEAVRRPPAERAPRGKRAPR